MSERIPVILDGDPGHDDAIAWLLANASPQLHILAVTTSAGNQTIEKTTYNALRICTLIGLRAPLARGCGRPLLAEPMAAESVHGASGLDGPRLPEPAFAPEPCTAVELMARVLSNSSQPVTIVATGPLTNVATLLLTHPALKPKIRRISLMGGGIRHGNWTPAAEFNILVDPEAANTVFLSGIPILMAGLDVTEQALLYPADFQRIRAVGNPVASVMAEWLEFFYEFHRKLGYAGAPVHDAVAVTALVQPELLTMRPLYVQIETRGQYCRGATVGDRMGALGKAPNVQWIYDIDRAGFADLLVATARHYGEEN